MLNIGIQIPTKPLILLNNKKDNNTTTMKGVIQTMSKRMTIAEFKEWLKLNVSILDYADKHHWIKRINDEQTQFCCIFHDEHNPSLQITDHFFRCYACGVKGDLIAFIMTKTSASFLETINDLADEYDIEIVLSRGERKVNDTWKKLSQEWETYQAGLYSETGKSQRKAAGEMGKLSYWDPCEIGWDTTLNAAVVPILSSSGKPLAFTKRLVTGSPKWKHSYIGASAIEQSEQLYGLYQCRKTLTTTGATVILAEGPKDAIAFWKTDGQPDGLHNALAVLGVSNAEKAPSAGSLSCVSNWKLAFDNDSAGEGATINAIIRLLMDTNMNNIQVANYKAHDPWDAVVAGETIEFISTQEWLKQCDRSWTQTLWQASVKMPIGNQSRLRTILANKEETTTTELDCESILTGKTYGDLSKAERIMKLRFKKGDTNNGKII